MEKETLKDSERTKCEIWSRVMGYLRPRSEYNIGKKAEHEGRKSFKEPTKLPKSKLDETENV